MGLAWPRLLPRVCDPTWIKSPLDAASRLATRGPGPCRPPCKHLFVALLVPEEVDGRIDCFSRTQPNGTAALKLPDSARATALLAAWPLHLFGQLAPARVPPQ